MEVRSLSPAVGAEVIGVDLNTIDDRDFARVREAFLDRCVLVFRDQRLDRPGHVAFSERWGEIQVNPIFAYVDGFPGVLEINNMGKEEAITENWHYDSTFAAKPPALTILAMDQMPSLGGDTMWSNQYVAYDRLSEPMKRMLAGLRGIFSGARVARARGNDDVPSASHPLVRTHPDTGRKALYIGNPDETLQGIEGMTRAESVPILKFLYDHSTQPDNVYRHMWRPGDVLMWDNRCTMHYAVHDYGTQVRRLFRTTIVGDVPA